MVRAPTNRATMQTVAFTRWDPLRDLLALHEQIGQLVGTDAPGWTPPVDLTKRRRFVLTAELPGLVARSDRDSRRREPHRDSRRARRGAGRDDPVRAVPSRRARPRPLLARLRAAGADRRRRVTADLKDGVLTVTMPKADDRARGASTSADVAGCHDATTCAVARARGRRVRRRPRAHRPDADGAADSRARTPAASTEPAAATARRRAATAAPAPPSPAAARTSRASPARRSRASRTSRRCRSSARRNSPFANDPFFRYFFGDDDLFGSRDRRSLSLGSGVIISADGYVVTNNHVVGENVARESRSRWPTSARSTARSSAPIRRPTSRC